MRDGKAREMARTTGAAKEREPQAVSSTPGGRAAAMTAIQAAIGNRATARLLAGSAISAAAPGLQTRLTLGAAGGPLEREADRLASEATGERPPATSGGLAPARGLSPAIAAGIARARGGGEALAPGLRAPFESRHGVDLGRVRVHRDAHAHAMASSLGAAAFTHQRDVFFAGGAYQPHTPAGRWLVGHELAHVAQQAGGAGPEVSAAPAGTVHAYFVVPQAQHEALGVAKHEATTFSGHERDADHPEFIDPETKAIHRVERADIPDLKVSDDGNMAVEHLTVDDPSREAEVCFAHTSVITAANKALAKAGSGITLNKVQDNALTVPKLGSTERVRLAKVEAQAATSYKKEGIYGFRDTVAVGGDSGPALLSKEKCNEMAETVMGYTGTKAVKAGPRGDLAVKGDFHDLGLTAYLAAYIEAKAARQSDKSAHQAGRRAIQALTIPDVKALAKSWDAPLVVVNFASKEQWGKFYDELGRLNMEALLRTKTPKTFEFIGTKDTPVADEAGRISVTLTVNDDSHLGTYADLLNTGSLSPFIAAWSSTAMTKRERPINKEELGAMVTEERLRVLETVTDHPALFEEANRVLKMNEYADPQIAEAFQIVHKGDGSARSFPYHFAGVVAKTGSDVLTFENYAREDHQGGGGDQRMFFQMYGPERDVTVLAGQASRDPESNERDELGRGSFHARWKGYFVDAQTVTVGRPK